MAGEFQTTSGLTPGFYEVRVRTLGSAFSNSVKIAVDVPATVNMHELKVVGMCDGRTWKTGEIWLNPHGVVSLWVNGLPENADTNTVEVVLDGRKLAVGYVSAFEEVSRPRQVNAKVPAGFRAGSTKLYVRVGSAVSDMIDGTVRIDSIG